MGDRRVSWAVGGAVLLLLGALTNSWWGVSAGFMEVNVGLRGVEVCAMGQCQSAPMSEVGQPGGLFSLFSLLTWGLSLLFAFLPVGLLLYGEQLGLHWANRIVRSGTLAVIPCGILTVFSMPAGSGVSISWGLFATIGGAVLAFSSLREADLYEGREYIPMTPPSTGPHAAAQPAAPSTAQAPQRASQPGQHPNQLSDMVKQASQVAPYQKNKALHKQLGTASQVQPAAADASRQALRFVAKQFMFSDEGLSWCLENGGQRTLTWNQIATVAVRQLPADPPFSSALFLDIVPMGSQPLRLLGSTQVNYHDLPEGAAPNSRENFRRFGCLVKQKTGGHLEEASVAFFENGQPPPKFFAMKQFEAYDAQFG